MIETGKIYTENCLETMARMPDGCLSYIITSPPYNLGEGMEDKGGLRVGHGGSRWKTAPLREGYATHTDAMPYGEYVEWQRIVLRECWRVIDDAGAIFFNHKPRIVKGKLRTPLTLIGDLPLRQIIIWNRRSGFNYSHTFYMPKHEWVLVLAKPRFKLRDKASSGFGDVWDIGFERGNPHPAPFPLELPLRILQTVLNTGKPVYDPFSGSGTTQIAAHKAGFDFIGSEISEEYVEIANERLAPYLAQEQLL